MGNFKFLTAFLFAFLFSVMGYGQEVLLNGGFESGVAKWKSYCDAAGTAPVDGVGGGGAGFTITSSTTSPLAGKASGIITKDAANRQGCGVSSDFTLANENKAKVLQIKLSYQVASGTYADDQYKVYVYDVDNSTLIEAAPTFIKNSSLVEQYRGVFQATLTGVNYRLIIHNASTSAVASTLRIEASVSSQLVAQGSYVGDWTQYTPTFGGFGTPTNVSMWWKIVGDNILIKGTFNSGITTAAIGTVSLPAGLSIDTSKISTSTYKTSFGRGWRVPISAASNLTTGSASVDNVWVYNGTTTLVQMASSTNTSPGYNNDNASTLANNTDLINIELLTIPIAGLGSNSALSSQYSQRDITAQVTIGNNQSVGNGSSVEATISTIQSDSHGAISGNVFTAPYAAEYMFNVKITWPSNASSYRQITLFKSTDGGATYPTTVGFDSQGANSVGQHVSHINRLVKLNAGDKVKLFMQQASGGSLTTVSDGNQNFMTITKWTGGTQVNANQLISAGYSSAAGQSISDNGSLATLATKDWDYTSAVTSSVFLSQNPGVYQACAAFTFVANGSGIRNIKLYKNGSVYRSGVSILGSASNNLTISNCFEANLLTGETLQFFPFQNTGGALSLTPNASENWVTYKRIGN